MGVKSIDEVLEYISDNILLNEFRDDGKELSLMAKGMSWVKTNMKLVINESDQTIADLMTDGCKYLNQYKAADEKSKDIAKRLIKSQEACMLSY